ncbi:MAG: SpoIIE family protein phosphatase [Clostridia bacterium]|nr:SpoIIE family protein phosphatase [Clostridia bacterium]
MAIQKFLKLGLSKVLGSAAATDEDGSLDLSRLDFVHIIKGLGSGLIAGLLGASGAAFSSYPLGIAYLCASDRYISASYLGLIVSALLNRGYALPLTVVYTVIVMLRYAIGRLLCDPSGASTARDGRILDRLRAYMAKNDPEGGIFGEGILLRVAVSCFAAFVFGLYRLIAGGFLYYDLFGLLAGFLICPIVTLALSGLFTKNEQFMHAAELSRAALMFIFVFALRGYSVLGFSLAFTAAFFVTLWAATSVGALKGCVVGLLAGLACGGINIAGAIEASEFSYSIGTAPCIIAAAGLCMGILWKFSRVAAVAASCAVGVTLGLVVDGYAVLPRLLPDIAAATAVFMPLAHFGLLPRLPVFYEPEHERGGEDVLILEKKQADANIRMNALSEAFSHLSDTVYSLSDRMRRPGVVDLKQVCDAAFDGFCHKCSLESFCLERECASTLDAQSKITSELYRTGHVDIDSVPSYLKDRCYNILPILDEINISTAKLIERLIKNDKTEAFALDYEVMSKLLSEQIAYNDAEYKVDDELTKKLRRSLKYMGIPAESALCFGSRKKQAIIGGVEVGRVKLGAAEIRRAVENTLETPMDAPRFNIEDGSVTMVLEARRRFKCEVAKSSSIKESESANGDCAATFENREDYFYMLISDGMGSGREAAITSKICAVFAERMLSAGNGKAVTLEMLNGFIRSRGSRGGECSATVDLAEIDLITGKACFVKSGAAPSFILRGGNLYKLQSKTVPLGIMPELDAEKIGFELMTGDVIIMLSDGVAQSLEDGVWLANLLTYEWEDDLNAMTAKILDNAVLSNKRSDDMTVVLVRIADNDAEA